MARPAGSAIFCNPGAGVVKQQAERLVLALLHLLPLHCTQELGRQERPRPLLMVALAGVRLVCVYTVSTGVIVAAEPPKLLHHRRNIRRTAAIARTQVEATEALGVCVSQSPLLHQQQ